MKKILKSWTLCAGLCAAISPAWAVSTDLQLVGLAVHQETGREIYLGAIHVDKLVPPPEDLMQFTGPKAMEYRVVARRTSIRSLLGSILLQAELASGSPASAPTAAFVDDILATVQGSLYAGDAFDVTLTENDEAVASLNGHELARSSDGTVFDYLLMGWLGEKGASADFRAMLLAPAVDESLLAAYHAHEATSDRVAKIGTWVAPAPVAAESAAPVEESPALLPPSEGETLAVSSPDETVFDVSASSEDIAPVATVASLDRSEPLLETAPEVSTDTAVSDPAESAVAAEAAAAEPVQLAAITPQGSHIAPDPSLSQALSLADYSEQLAEFNTMIMKKVYAKIRYPKSAVRRSLQGNLELDLHLNPDGSLKEALVARSSGHKTLDQAAVRAADNAFEGSGLGDISPAASSEYSAEDGQMVVPVPISFRLME